MPHRDAEAARMERLLRTLTPPAAVTAPYRLQVVQAAFEARLNVLARRTRRRCTAVVLLVCCLLALPGWLLGRSGLGDRLAASGLPWPLKSAVPIDLQAKPSAAIDGYESSLIHAHVHSRA